MVRSVTIKIKCTAFIAFVFLFNYVESNIVPARSLIYNSNGLGTYSFAYETEDGSFRREEGGSNPVDGSLVVRGEFGYIDARGRLYTVHYVADSNGFQPLASDETRFNNRNIV